MSIGFTFIPIHVITPALKEQGTLPSYVPDKRNADTLEFTQQDFLNSPYLFFPPPSPSPLTIPIPQFGYKKVRNVSEEENAEDIAPKNIQLTNTIK